MRNLASPPLDTPITVGGRRLEVPALQAIERNTVPDLRASAKQNSALEGELRELRAALHERCWPLYG